MTLASPCPVTFTNHLLGGKWKPRIVWALTRTETLRFSELRRACPPISDRILSKELKQLEGWGLIARTVYAVVPPHTEYSLTALGRTLEPIMAAMARWGVEQRDNVLAREPGGTEPRRARPPDLASPRRPC